MFRGENSVYLPFECVILSLWLKRAPHLNLILSSSKGLKLQLLLLSRSLSYAHLAFTYSPSLALALLHSAQPEQAIIIVIMWFEVHR